MLAGRQAAERLERLAAIPRSADLLRLVVAVVVKAAPMQRHLLAAAEADRLAQGSRVAARRPYREETREMRTPALRLAGRAQALEVTLNTEVQEEVETPMSRVPTRCKMVAGQCSEGLEVQVEAVSIQAMRASCLEPEDDADFTRPAVALVAVELTARLVQPELMEA